MFLMQLLIPALAPMAFQIHRRWYCDESLHPTEDYDLLIHALWPLLLIWSNFIPNMDK